MGRIVYIDIAGKSYPMSFSLGASKKIIGKYGSAEKMKSAMEKAKDVDKIEIVTEMIELLTTQGCAYMNYFEKDMPKPDNAPVVDGKWAPLPREVVEIAIGISEVEELVEKITECIDGGSRKEVETRTEGKNAESGQE